MKKIVALILALSMVFALCGCGSSREKELLCSGVWAKVTRSDPSWSVDSYEFSTNGKFVYTRVFAGIITNVTELKGSYKIDTTNKQIVLKYDKTDERESYTVEIPYAINEYTHEFIFHVDSNGGTKWGNYPSLDSVPTP